MLQSVHFFKHRGVAAEGGRGVKAAGAATAGFLTVAGVRCGVGAEEGAAEAAGDQLPQSLLMNIAFKYRQTASWISLPSYTPQPPSTTPIFFIAFAPPCSSLKPVKNVD